MKLHKENRLTYLSKEDISIGINRSATEPILRHFNSKEEYEASVEKWQPYKDPEL
jgi:hypothetical protein